MITSSGQAWESKFVKTMVAVHEVERRIVWARRQSFIQYQKG